MTDQSRIYGGLKSQSDTSRLDDRDAEWENALSQGPDGICGPSFCMCPAPLALLSPCWKEIPLIGCSAQWTSPPEEEVAGGRLKLKPSEPVAEVDCDPFSAFFPNFSPQTYSRFVSALVRVVLKSTTLSEQQFPDPQIWVLWFPSFRLMN